MRKKLYRAATSLYHYAGPRASTALTRYGLWLKLVNLYDEIGAELAAMAQEEAVKSRILANAEKYGEEYREQKRRWLDNAGESDGIS